MAIIRGSSSNSSGYYEYLSFQPSSTEYHFEGTFVNMELAALLDAGIPIKHYPPISAPVVTPVFFTPMWRQQFKGHNFKLGGSKK